MIRDSSERDCPFCYLVSVVAMGKMQALVQADLCYTKKYG